MTEVCINSETAHGKHSVHNKYSTGAISCFVAVNFLNCGKIHKT